MNETDTIKQEISVQINRFSVITESPEEFIEELETLCKKYCLDGGYFFTYSFEG